MRLVNDEKTKSKHKRWHRKSIRLKNYDYSRPGMYFVTICAQNHRHLFGRIKNDRMILNQAGVMVAKIWAGISNQCNNINLREYVVMPDHFHGIVQIIDDINVGNIPNNRH